MCLRVAIYWLCFLSVTAVLLGCWLALREAPLSFSEWFTGVWNQYGPALVVASLIFPVVLLDFLIVSNKFAGPLRRLHTAMKRLGDGEHVEPMRIRDNDFCGEFAEEFNRILKRMNSLERTAPAPESSTARQMADSPDCPIRVAGSPGSANSQPQAKITRSPNGQR
jgi:hypothetical protein